MNKKGAEMTIGTIVIIVLALIVLVVLVVGFTAGWGNLWGRISAFFGGSNVDAVVQACNVACTTEAQNDYCDRVRKVTTESDKLEENCYNLGLSHTDLGFTPCDKITCPT